MIKFNELLERAKSERIVVHTSTEEQAKALLTELDKKEYTWSSGYKLTTRTNYEVYKKEDTCYNLELDKKVMYSPLSFYQKYGYTIIEFKDIDFKEKGMKKDIKPITIYETKKCDTRAIEKIFTDEDVKSDTLKHRNAVIDGCDFIADKLREQSFNHDYTKLGKYLAVFTRALKTGFKDDEFKKINWWNIHKTKERHHLNDNCPDDVNIIDVIEMIVDCTMAGLARTGKVYDISIKPEILKKAVDNTVKLLIDNTKVLK